jgi:hypothetical protein
MERPSLIRAAALAACCLPCAAIAAQTMERVNLVDGRHYEGLVESSGDDWVYFIQIQRPPGQPMHLVIRTLDRGSVVSIAPLAEGERAALAGQIRQFVNRAAIEAGRMEAVALAPLDQEGNHYLHYAGKWFTLDSTADERTTRRVIVRVEQIFAAYRQMLAPRPLRPRPPRLVVFNSMEKYRAFLAARGVKIQNPACFLEAENVVAVGSELAQLALRMAKVNHQTDQIRRELRVMEIALPGRLADIAADMRRQGSTPAQIARAEATVKRQFQSDVGDKKKDLDRCDRLAAREFQTSTRQVFARVYHEAFHAYLENCVFPHRQYDVPRWLNEGLAVTFEGGILEADTLRVDAPNAVALKRLKADLAGPQPLSLERLLSTDAGAFLQRHDADPATSDRLYVYAWGLAYYLAFEKHLLDSPELAEYVAADAKKLAPAPRFERLVGMSLPAFEQQWRKYVLTLR